MDEESLVIRDLIQSEPTAFGMQALHHPQSPVYLKFRIGRETQRSSKCISFLLAVFKVCFCSLGLWGHQSWNYIPRVLISAAGIYQVFVVSYVDVLGNKCYHVKYSNLTGAKKQALRHAYIIGNIDVTIFTVASTFSFLVFIGCFMAARRKESALISPSQSLIKDIDKRGTLLLFLALLIITLLLSSTNILWNIIVSDNLTEVKQLSEDSFCKALLGTGEAAQFVLYWVSLNICHIFAVISLALGRLSFLIYFPFSPDVIKAYSRRPFF